MHRRPRALRATLALIGAAVLALPAHADIVVQSQSRGVRGTSYARVGPDGTLSQDQIATSSGDAFNEDIVVSAFGQGGAAEASSGAVQSSRVSPTLLSARIGSNGVSVSNLPDTFGEGRGDGWYDVVFTIDEPHTVAIDVVIDNLIRNGDDTSVAARFLFASGDDTLFEVTQLGEHAFAATIAPGEYTVRAGVVATSRSADGAGLAVANLRQTFNMDLTVVPAPPAALPLVLAPLALRRRHR